MRLKSSWQGYNRRLLRFAEGFKADSVTITITGIGPLQPFLFELEVFTADPGTKPSCAFAPWQKRCGNWNEFAFHGSNIFVTKNLAATLGQKSDDPQVNFEHQRKWLEFSVASISQSTAHTPDALEMCKDDKVTKALGHEIAFDDIAMSAVVPIDGRGNWAGYKVDNRAVVCDRDRIVL